MELQWKPFFTKGFLITFILVAARFGGLAKDTKDPLMNSPTVVWAGLDYSMVRMIGGEKFEYGFQVPDIIFPTMLEKWNQLFLDERISLLANALGKKVSVDIGGVTDRNKTAKADQIIPFADSKDTVDKSHITPDEISGEIQSYKLTKTNGLGLCFIVDRLVQRYAATPAGPVNNHITASPICQTAAAVYVVFFDITTRRVLTVEREVHSVSRGASFRNFWFGPIKDTDKTLDKYKTKSENTGAVFRQQFPHEAKSF